LDGKGKKKKKKKQEGGRDKEVLWKCYSAYSNRNLVYLHDFSFGCPVKAGLINASLKNHTTLTNQRNGNNAKPPKKCVDGNQGKRTKQHKANNRSFESIVE